MFSYINYKLIWNLKPETHIGLPTDGINAENVQVNYKEKTTIKIYTEKDITEMVII